jgi:hypothetical protein
MCRFSHESSELEHLLRKGVSAGKSVLESTVLPTLLEGVLVLGNYVNAGSTALGGAVGVTLESLAKLSHTKTLEADGGKKLAGDNALHLLVWQLEEQQPGFLPTLISDLEQSRATRDLDQKKMAHSVKSRTEQVETLLHLAADDEPAALKPKRIREFLDVALPAVKTLDSLYKELAVVSSDLRRYFAEPAETTLAQMMRSLLALRDKLPAVPTSRQRTRRQRPTSKAEDERRRCGSSLEDLRTGGDVRLEMAGAVGDVGVEEESESSTDEEYQPCASRGQQVHRQGPAVPGLLLPPARLPDARWGI